MRADEEQDTASHEASLGRDAARLQALAGGVVPVSGYTLISKPGYYRVVEDFESDGNGIVIRSDHVWLEIFGHSITGPGSQEGIGVLVQNAAHVFVGKGVIGSFNMGVVLENSTHCAVHGITVEGSDEVADPPDVQPEIGFALVNSSRSVLFGNTGRLVTFGIFARGGDGTNNLVSRNRMIAGDNGLLAVWYNPEDGQGMEAPHHDLVRRNFLSRFQVGIQTMPGAHHNRYVRNEIEYFVVPWQDLNGTNLFIENETTQL
jgi:hypothetical protein